MNNYPGNHLGVNKMGKNIRKSPLHQPNYTNPNNNKPQQPPPQQPHVYNINKNEFRDMVQQLTGSPSHNQTQPPPRPAPSNNLPKSQSLRLQRIRPPPLTPISPPPRPLLYAPPPQVPLYNNNYGFRPQQQGPPHPSMPSPVNDTVWANTAESPISAYMRYLQNSMNNPSPMQPQPQPQHRPEYQNHPSGPAQAQSSSLSGLLPNPHIAPTFPSPRGAGPALLPSPTSPFVMPSPTSFLNLFSPRSPYPLQSPGFQFPSPLTPSFFSPLSQSGILGPGPPSPSQGLLFPPSPSGFFPMSSPRWRNQ